MEAQRDIYDQSVTHGADYVISLKGNKGTLYQDMVTYFRDPSFLSDGLSSEENDFTQCLDRSSLISVLRPICGAIYTAYWNQVRNSLEVRVESILKQIGIEKEKNCVFKLKLFKKKKKEGA